MKSASKQDSKQRQRRHGSANPSGFTLIELMLVLVILATLAAIVLPKFTGRSQQAKIISAKTQISQLEVALDAFEIDLGRYPTTTEGLRALVIKPTSDSDGSAQRPITTTRASSCPTWSAGSQR